jgi:dihydroorotate dehydrogenase (NAD+) catalytic subunit
VAELAVRIGPIELENPVLAGSGEATMTADQIRACLEAGAAAVVAKSTNESDVAKTQLRAAQYVLLDETLEARPLGPARRGDSLFSRSGLVDEPFERWLETLAELDGEAAKRSSYVVPSLIVGDLDAAVEIARAFEQAGLRWLELNVGAPHAQEAAPGAIATGGALVRPIRKAVSLPLSVKVATLEDAALAFDAGADAVVLATRAQGFVPDLETRRPLLGTFAAIGGAWAVPLTCRELAKARRRFGRDACLIGTNGARDGRDVARFLLSGATAAQLTTAVMTDGPAVLTRAVEQLDAYLDEQGLSASELIGEAADAVQTYEEAALERRH